MASSPSALSSTTRSGPMLPGLHGMRPSHDSSPSATHVVFEYCYRDASNYRAHEWLLLAGAASPEAEEAIRCALIDRTWFVAEAVGVPTLYDRLQHPNGPSDDDHGWHEFVRLRAATTAEVRELRVFESLSTFTERLGDGQAPR